MCDGRSILVGRTHGFSTSLVSVTNTTPTATADTLSTTSRRVRPFDKLRTRIATAASNSSFVTRLNMARSKSFSSIKLRRKKQPPGVNDDSLALSPPSDDSLGGDAANHDAISVEFPQLCGHLQPGNSLLISRCAVVLASPQQAARYRRQRRILYKSHSPTLPQSIAESIVSQFSDK